MFFVFLVPPWGLPLYPFTPNDPKNEKYIAIPFICHPGDHSVLENGWVIHIWSGGKIFIFEDEWTYEWMDEQTNGPDNYNDQDTIQTVSIWLKNYPYYYPYYPMGPLLLAPAGPIIFFHALFTKKTKNQNYIAIPFICHLHNRSVTTQS